MDIENTNLFVDIEKIYKEFKHLGYSEILETYFLNKFKEGYQDGYDDGYSEGLVAGYSEGYVDSVYDEDEEE